VLVSGWQTPRLGSGQAEYLDEHWARWHVRQDVQRLWSALEAVEVLGEADLGPRHALVHGLVRVRFDPSHRLHRVLAHLGSNGCKAEAAIADGDRGDAMPARQRAIRIPEHLRVIVGVQVDEPGCDVLVGPPGQLTHIPIVRLNSSP